MWFEHGEETEHVKGWQYASKKGMEESRKRGEMMNWDTLLTVVKLSSQRVHDIEVQVVVEMRQPTHMIRHVT